MDARNRMEDVRKLRCNACQDFLRMILKEGWQQKLYDKAYYAVTNNTVYKKNYIAVYEEMRNSVHGIDNYSVDKMDVTIITELILSNRFKGIEPVADETRDAMRKLRDNRNIKDHSNENEEPKVLYLRGLIALCNLRDFVRTVDKKEKRIEDEKRLAYRQKYIPLIDSLQELLDEERIELIQKEKNMRRDIQRVLNSDDQLKTWVDIYEHYMNRYEKVEHNHKALNEFIVCASDLGVVYAHLLAASLFLYSNRDYEEAERRILMLCESKIELTTYDVHGILDIINQIDKKTEGIQKIIKDLQEKGFEIEQYENGVYELDKR